ncbi:MAG TPA: GNAT family N-acetyltransferase [Novosphingobium sp.]|nr:GNAT family N-acetyltransferase [Novosphingobium sp.]
MVAVEYHSDLKEVQSDPLLGPALSADARDTPFDRIEWWRALAEHCGLDPLIAVARDGGGIAVLPLARDGNKLGALANWYTFRWRPLLVGSNAPQLLKAIAGDLASRSHRLTLTGVPDEDGSATMLAEAFAASGWLVRREQGDVNHVLPVNGRSWEQYHAGLPGTLRTTLKRKSNKVACRVHDRFDADAWSAYEAIYARSWKPEEGSPAFLRAFAKAEGAAGRLRLAVAHTPEGEPIAAQMWTVEGSTAFIHKLAHREDASALSPGSVLSAVLFRHVIDMDKVSLIDFGTGDDAYKRDWMEQVRPRWRLDLMRPMHPRNWLSIAKAELRRLARRGRCN